MNAALDFATLADLAGNSSTADIPCPLCGPDRSTRATQRKLVMRIWRPAPDFASYSCARCGEHGYATDRHAKPVDRREFARRLRAAHEHQAEAEAKRRSTARWILAQSQPIEGTIAESYLRGRGITNVPPTLRFLPARGGHAPAMLAAFGHPSEPEPGRYDLGSAAVHAVHITRLMPDGSDKAADAKGRLKIMVGVTEGWPIALVPPNDAGGLCIAEGIEDALSIAQATGLGAWAAGAAGRLAKLAPLIAQLPYIEHVTIAVDDDAAGRRHAYELANELRRLCRRSLEVVTIEFDEVTHEAA
jgi:hypothetical protein